MGYCAGVKLRNSLQLPWMARSFDLSTKIGCAHWEYCDKFIPSWYLDAQRMTCNHSNNVTFNERPYIISFSMQSFLSLGINFRVKPLPGFLHINNLIEVFLWDSAVSFSNFYQLLSKCYLKMWRVGDTSIRLKQGGRLSIGWQVVSTTVYWSPILEVRLSAGYSQFVTLSETSVTHQCGNLLWIDRKGSGSRYAPDLIEFV